MENGLCSPDIIIDHIEGNMKKGDRDIVILAFKTQFINFDKQKEDSPQYIMNSYIHWLYDQWKMGLINLNEYRALIKVNILEV